MGTLTHRSKPLTCSAKKNAPFRALILQAAGLGFEFPVTSLPGRTANDLQGIPRHTDAARCELDSENEGFRPSGRVSIGSLSIYDYLTRSEH
jgi:hypothetical protein